MPSHDLPERHAFAPHHTPALRLAEGLRPVGAQVLSVDCRSNLFLIGATKSGTTCRNKLLGRESSDWTALRGATP
jgi:hypothetical protein